MKDDSRRGVYIGCPKCGKKLKKVGNQLVCWNNQCTSLVIKPRKK